MSVLSLKQNWGPPLDFDAYWERRKEIDNFQCDQGCKTGMILQLQLDQAVTPDEIYDACQHIRSFDTMMFTWRLKEKINEDKRWALRKKQVFITDGDPVLRWKELRKISL